MVIKNKDGTPYKLSKPNPLMITQEFWGKNFILHNMNFKTETHPGNTVPQPQQYKESFVSELTNTKPTPPPSKITIIHCLPAELTEHKDNLYGDAFTTVKYKNPFTFEGIITNTTDLQIEIWTNIDKISIGSVIYPQSQEKRWWKVTEITNKPDGWLISGVISDYQPAFR